jgi:hypothetical protein
MRNLHEIDRYRLTTKEVYDRYGSSGDETCGVFVIPFQSYELRVIASNGGGWDHLSISLTNRTPNWKEMEYIKRLFFKPEEMAIQFHVPESKHINVHPNCLHLWRPQNFEIQLPPAEFV